jgi:hypothetical protein
MRTRERSQDSTLTPEVVGGRCKTVTRFTVGEVTNERSESARELEYSKKIEEGYQKPTIAIPKNQQD